MHSTLETYLLKNGAGRSVFSQYFREKYAADIDRLFLLYHCDALAELKEGTHPYDTYLTCLRAYGWGVNYYTKITSILLYLGMIEPTEPCRQLSPLREVRKEVEL